MRPGRIRIKTGGNTEGDGETVVKDPSDENVWNLRTGNYFCFRKFGRERAGRFG